LAGRDQQNLSFVNSPLRKSSGGSKPSVASAKTRYRGLAKVDFAGYVVSAAYNLIRPARMVTAPTPA
jgi:hypothetical protein